LQRFVEATSFFNGASLLLAGAVAAGFQPFKVPQAGRKDCMAAEPTGAETTHLHH
jgi:hypothetical protein